MYLKGIITIVLVLCVTATQKKLTGSTLQWSFPSDTRVSFSLTIEDDIFSSHGWYGIAFKPEGSGTSMGGGDYVVIKFDQEEFSDRYAQSNGKPDKDDSDSLLQKTVSSDKKTYTWSRDLKGDGSSQDIDLSKDQKYTVLWAYGPMGNSDINYHSSRGSSQITLSDGSDSGDSTSDSGDSTSSSSGDSTSDSGDSTSDSGDSTNDSGDSTSSSSGDSTSDSGDSTSEDTDSGNEEIVDDSGLLVFIEVIVLGLFLMV